MANRSFWSLAQSSEDAYQRAMKMSSRNMKFLSRAMDGTAIKLQKREDNDE